ncbi:MAG: SHOCT-like domain-containing protein [Phenylobacterium sp.]
MNDDRRSVLQMLAEGKINADEAERLIAAMERNGSTLGSFESASAGHNKPPPKYLRVSVDAADADEGPTKVNIRVPMALLRAGVRLTSLIPPAARNQVNAELAKNGVPFDIGQLKPENLEDLIAHLEDFSVDVDAQDAKVRVYCE